jgi:hypothetical protein
VLALVLDAHVDLIVNVVSQSIGLLISPDAIWLEDFVLLKRLTVGVSLRLSLRALAGKSGSLALIVLGLPGLDVGNSING